MNGIQFNKDEWAIFILGMLFGVAIMMIVLVCVVSL